MPLAIILQKLVSYVWQLLSLTNIFSLRPKQDGHCFNENITLFWLNWHWGWNKKVMILYFDLTQI